jgi:hypothetical protein
MKKSAVIAHFGSRCCKAAAKKQFYSLPVFWPVTGVASAGTYPDMRRRM